MRQKKGNVKRLAEEWIAVKKGEVKVTTVSTYGYVLSHYILPELGECAVEKLTPERTDEFVRRLREGKLEARTINSVLSVLKMMLRYAEKNNYAMPKSCEIRSLRERGKQISILSEEEQRRLELFLREDGDRSREGIRAGIILSLYTGLRIGEVCALKWEDIDFPGSLLYVKKTISRIKNTDEEDGKKTRIEIGRPKTDTSFRQIPLPAFLRAYLRRIRKAPDCFVLTGTKRFLEPRAYQYQYKKIMRELKLEDCNYHMLRHTFATRAIEAGFDVKSLSEILGHANVNITLNRYAHPTMKMKLFNMEKLGDFYQGPSAGNARKAVNN